MTRVALGIAAAVIYVLVIMVLVAMRDSGTFIRTLSGSLLVPGAVLIAAATIRRRHGSPRG